MGSVDGMAAAFLRRNPCPGFWGRLWLMIRPGVVHATAETFVFVDGSRLDIVKNGPDTEFKAYGSEGLGKIDGMAAAFLRRNPDMGFVAALSLSLRPETEVVHAVAEIFTFPDGSRLDIIENGPDTEYRTYGPGVFDG